MIDTKDCVFYDILWHSHDSEDAGKPEEEKLTEFKNSIAAYFDDDTGFNWSNIPEIMGFWQSLKFAYIMNGYAITSKLYKSGQFGDDEEFFGGTLGKLATVKFEEYKRNRKVWAGSALELWLTLYMNHRWVRMNGIDVGWDENDKAYSLYNDREISPDYDSLVQELRRQLIAKNYF